jgi:probable F420-dependent oxidoreductase
MAVKVGVALQSYTIPGGEARQAQQLEREGYDYVGAGEHVAFHAPSSNSFIALSVAAGATRRIRLMNAVVQTPVYPAALLAKMSAALDVASGGRFELGIGVGGEFPAEYEACGVSIKERGARTDESLEIITRLLSQDRVSYDGKYARLSDVSIRPRPVQNPLPLWVSGRKQVAMGRAARFGSGWLPYMYTPSMVADSIKQIEELRPAGRAPVEAGVLLWGCVHQDTSVARQMVAAGLGRTYDQDFTDFIDRYCFAGTAERVAARLLEYVDAGVTTILVSFACPENYRESSQALFTESVLPELRRA